MRIEGPRPPEVAWKPHPGPQTAFLASSTFEVLYGGARAGGKSDCLLYGGLRQIHHPKYRALILRRTFPELRELIDRSHEYFEAFGGTWIASEKRWVFPSGATYEFGYCETIKEAQQYRGQQYTYIGFDEIGLIADEQVWLTLLTSIRHTADGLVKMARCSANPGGPGHGWIKRRFIAQCPPDGTPIFDEAGMSRAFFQAKVYDNPSILTKDPEYLRQLQGLPELMRRRELDGDWDAGEGIAFPGLTLVSHRTDATIAIPSNWRLFGAFDWGFGHKWAFGLFAIQPSGHVTLLDSRTGRRDIPAVIVSNVQDLLGLYSYGHEDLSFRHLAYTVAGSDVKIRDEARGANGPSVAEQFSQYGWYLINADNSRVAGYQNLLTYLHFRALSFADTPGNRQGVAQLMEMATDPDFPNDVLKVDVNPITGKGGDDWYDMVRYGLMSRPLNVQPKQKLKYSQDASRPPEPPKVSRMTTPSYARLPSSRTSTFTRVD